MQGTYQDHYLEQYWPPRPNNPDMWQDNLELLQAYFLAADKVLTAEKGTVSALDISTGPCLAPLMATMACIESVRLSDYTASNREEIVASDVTYWAEYAKELVRIFPNRGLSVETLLSRVDQLRKQSLPLDVDLRRNPIFLPDEVPPSSVGFLTMHFVVDSICETSDECFDLLQRSLTFIKPNGWLLLSALIDSDGWQLGETKQPSPSLTEPQIDRFLETQRFEVLTRTRSVRKANQIYEGGWTVYLARKGLSQ